MKVEQKVRHPAKFAKGFIETAREILNAQFAFSPNTEKMFGRRIVRVLDPFAGVGGIFLLENSPTTYDRLQDTETNSKCIFVVTGLEIEPEWAGEGTFTFNVDSIAWMKTELARLKKWNSMQGCLDLWEGSIPIKMNAVVTSPCYGNRMADKFINDGTRRNTYANALGRNLTEGNSGSLQWGVQYREFHTEAWRLAVELLSPGGLFILNIKDHIRNGVHQYVSEWHKNTLENLGMEYDHHVMIPVRGLQQGQNAEVRVPYEWVILFRKPS